MMPRWTMLTVLVVVVAVAAAMLAVLRYGNPSLQGPSAAPPAVAPAGRAPVPTASTGVDDQVQQMVDQVLTEAHWDKFETMPSFSIFKKLGDEEQERYPTPRMPPAEYAQAKAVYLAFLDNFARIEDIEFEVKSFEVLRDGSERPRQETKVVSAYPKYMMDFTFLDEGNAGQRTIVKSNGEQFRFWRDGKPLVYGHDYHDACCMVGEYLHQQEMASAGKEYPYFLNVYDHFAPSTNAGEPYRMWSDAGDEALFDAASGMLLSRRYANGRTDTFTYKQVGNIWFPEGQLSVDPTDRPFKGQDVWTLRREYSASAINAGTREDQFNLDTP